MLLVEHVLEIFPSPSVCVCETGTIAGLSRKFSHEHAILQPVPHR